jgi:hypothetical protein
MARQSVSVVLVTALACCAGVAACSAAPRGHASASSTTSSAASGGSAGASAAGGSAADAGADDALALDASGYCGNQFHKVISDPPNLYFVFDVSSSMAEMAGGGFSKYQLVEHSAVLMIETLGSLINVGAAVFPHNASAASPCQVGAEVFPVSPGDPKSPMVGPTTEGFIQATTLTPQGGTPTAATLTTLTPGLVALKGRTIVILSTDGGPNCNAELSCGVDQCIPNIEGICNPPSANCCAPNGLAGPQGCIDHDATVAAVAALAAANVRVVVVGVPGSATYAAVLNDMAMAGGAPQPGPPSYYEVDDLTTLTQVFQGIAASYISCDIALQDPPADMSHTNVYFDGNLVLEDPQNGWTWKGISVISFVGAACQDLKAGKINQIHVVSGCPTQAAM